MKVATWNVNSLTARWPRVARVDSTARTRRALIQETKQSDEKFPFAALAELGYDAAHFGQGHWNGVAIISRVWLERRAPRTRATTPRRASSPRPVEGLRVYSCYVPNGRALDDPHYDYKLRWLETLRVLLAERDRTQPVMVGGDFNVALSDLDVYDPAVFEGATHVSSAERAALRAVLATDLVDLGRLVHAR